jgi:hypothetical protein
LFRLVYKKKNLFYSRGYGERTDTKDAEYSGTPDRCILTVATKLYSLCRFGSIASRFSLSAFLIDANNDSETLETNDRSV